VLTIQVDDSAHMRESEAIARLADHDRVVVSRPLSVRLAASFGGALIALVVIAITSAALPSTIGGLVAILGVPVVVYASIRGFRISLRADPHEIVVRNYFRTHRLRWEDIETIEIGLHGMAGAPLDAIIFRCKGRGAVSSQATVSNSHERRRVLLALKGLRPDLPIRSAENG
jgi:hypothetical protein